jgi:hypothetical protein
VDSKIRGAKFWELLLGMQGLKASGLEVGLLLNFNVIVMKGEIK